MVSFEHTRQTAVREANESGHHDVQKALVRVPVELTEALGVFVAPTGRADGDGSRARPVDSIQAGFRGTGYLSIVDGPGFEDCEAPDLESWSKARKLLEIS